MKVLFALTLALTAAAPAYAGSVDMTCAQAKATYNRNGRIYVRTNSGAVVPIYGLVRRCSWGYRASPYWVQAYDNKRCLIGYRCYREDRN